MQQCCTLAELSPSKASSSTSCCTSGEYTRPDASACSFSPCCAKLWFTAPKSSTAVSTCRGVGMDGGGRKQGGKGSRDGTWGGGQFGRPHPAPHTHSILRPTSIVDTETHTHLKPQQRAVFVQVLQHIRGARIHRRLKHTVLALAGRDHDQALALEVEQHAARVGNLSMGGGGGGGGGSGGGGGGGGAAPPAPRPHQQHAHTLPPPLVMAALTSEAERFTLSVTGREGGR